MTPQDHHTQERLLRNCANVPAWLRKGAYDNVATLLAEIVRTALDTPANEEKPYD